MAYTAGRFPCNDCGVIYDRTTAGRCPPCQSAFGRSRRDTDEYRAKNAARMRAYRVQRPEIISAVAKRSYTKNRDKILERSKAYREENLEAHRAKDRAYYAALPDKAMRRAHGRASYQRCREQHAAKNAAWRKANPHLTAMYAHRRRTAEQGAERYRILEKELRRMVDRYRGCCAYCGERAKLEWEHVIPISRGGRQSIGNIVPACRSCNASKFRHYLSQWRHRIEVTQVA